MDRGRQDQQLKRDLSGLAADLKWSAVELAQIAERLKSRGNDPDAQALHRMATMLRKDEQSLEQLAHQLLQGTLGHREVYA